MKIQQENDNEASCSNYDVIFKMCLPIGRFLHVFFSSDKVQISLKVTMATMKRLSMIWKFENLANNYLGKVTKFQGNGFCRFGVLRHLISFTWKQQCL